MGVQLCAEPNQRMLNLPEWNEMYEIWRAITTTSQNRIRRWATDNIQHIPFICWRINIKKHGPPVRPPCRAQYSTSKLQLAQPWLKRRCHLQIRNIFQGRNVKSYQIQIIFCCNLIKIGKCDTRGLFLGLKTIGIPSLPKVVDRIAVLIFWVCCRR